MERAKRGLGAARIHDPPGPVELPGGGCAFRVGPHFSRPSAQQCLRRQRWMSQAEPTGPLYAATLSDPRLGATTVKATAGCCPPSQLRPLEVEWARGVLASGMPVGIPPCGVRRRHLFGCQGALSVLSGPDARGCVTISAASIRRASSAGVSIRDIVPAGTASLSLRQADYLSRDRAEARASWLSIAQAFLPVSRSCLPWVSQPCQVYGVTVHS